MNKYLAISSIVFISYTTNPAFAVEQTEWPQGPGLMRAIATPYTPMTFSHQEGLMRVKQWADDQDHFIFKGLHGTPGTARSCDRPARKPGFIQTTKYVNEENPFRAKIGVPISIRLETQFTGTKKENLLNSTLFTVSVLALDGDDGDIRESGLAEDQLELDTGSYELVRLHRFPFTIRKLCSQLETCAPLISAEQRPIQLVMNQPVWTESFLMPKGNRPYEFDLQLGRMNMLNPGKVRIRIDWAFQGICDEDYFEFKVGDQIRIVDPFLI